MPSVPSSEFLSDQPGTLLFPPVCVAVSGATVEAMLASAAALAADYPFLEFRMDYLPYPQSAVRALWDGVTHTARSFLLATCRRRESGGHFLGTAQDELAVLASAAGTGFPLVDLSLESAEELGPQAVNQLRQLGTKVVLSFHDFVHTPDLDRVLARMQPFAPDVFKVVSTAESLVDSVRVLRFLRGAQMAGASALVGIAMGEYGVLTRILGPRAGSAFTFGAASDAEATAPGQLTAETLTQLYRVEALDASTRIYGVAGDPIRSSLSPLMLNTAFHESGVDGVYLPLRTGNAEELFRCAQDLPLQGFSVTMPLKQAVMPLLDHVDPLAARIGAVNTVRRMPDGALHGYNTDAAGIVAPLESRLSLRGAQILVLGAGGAARAAVFGCLEQGAHVSICNRTPEAAQRLAKESGALPVARDALGQQSYDVLIQATPAGMRGQALTLPLADDELRADLVFDLVYNPLETPLLALARAQGKAVIPGVEMFVHQGARQFEIWTGQAAPVAAMRDVVLQFLQASRSGA